MGHPYEGQRICHDWIVDCPFVYTVQYVKQRSIVVENAIKSVSSVLKECNIGCYTILKTLYNSTR